MRLVSKHQGLNQWLKWFCEAGGLTRRSQVGANPIPIPTPLIWRFFRHKITLYRFNQVGLILLQGGLKWAPSPHFNHWTQLGDPFYAAFSPLVLATMASHFQFTAADVVRGNAALVGATCAYSHTSSARPGGKRTRVSISSAIIIHSAFCIQPPRVTA